ncbi:MAG: aminotransferase class I/II-fold pyridoxal phosphate-dependent enzyme, partial [Micrococcaceae bacterium]|nr:aminotransferase class I/II-fold pyridoxal phosphate-dependent enzyme [Micrococcaceae bacterium]
AVASLAHYDKVVERVQRIVDERTRVVNGLKGLGWNIPVSDGNFVWLPLGENTAEFAELASEQALALRAFGNEGIRVTIGEVEANTRFLELCRNYPKGSLLS